jgi:tryptophan halogenase
LASKLDMFRRNGRIFRENNELFTETSWLSVMIGQGIHPEGYHPAADLLPDEETLHRLSHVREVVANTAQLMPMQDEYLQQQGSASNAVLRRAS